MIFRKEFRSLCDPSSSRIIIDYLLRITGYTSRLCSAYTYYVGGAALERSKYVVYTYYVGGAAGKYVVYTYYVGGAAGKYVVYTYYVCKYVV